MRIFSKTIFLVLVLLSTSLQAAEDNELAQVRKNITSLFPGEGNYKVARTPVPGLFEIDFGDSFVYITRDGKYAVRGEIIDIASNVSITEQKRSKERLRVFSKVNESDMLVYAPKDGKYTYTINVFTDIDCSYCRRLHSEMNQYLQRGIRVRYLFYPRAGKGSVSYKKAVSVWCSADRHVAMDKAKQGLNIKEKTCENPVDNHMRMAEQLSVTGTPTIILEDGGRLPGYVNAAQLLHTLQQRKAVAQATP